MDRLFSERPLSSPCLSEVESCDNRPALYNKQYGRERGNEGGERRRERDSERERLGERERERDSERERERDGRERGERRGGEEDSTLSATPTCGNKRGGASGYLLWNKRRPSGCLLSLSLEIALMLLRDDRFDVLMIDLFREAGPLIGSTAFAR